MNRNDFVSSEERQESHCGCKKRNPFSLREKAGMRDI